MLFWFTSLSVILMIVVPVLLAARLRRSAPAPWLLFCAGMLTFAASQAVHLPLNELLSDLGWMPAPGTGDVPLWRIALLAGLTAGLCEELARAAGYWLLRRARSASDGIMLGLGHGGFESMVFGGVMTAATLSALLPLQGQDLAQMNLLPEQIQAVQQQMETLLGSPWSVFAPLLERLVAMGIHVTLSLMVLQAFQRRQPAWVGLAILYHALIDMLAVLTTRGIKAPNTWVILAGFLLIALPGWIWAILIVRKAGLPAAAQAQPLGKLYLWLPAQCAADRGVVADPVGVAQLAELFRRQHRRASQQAPQRAVAARDEVQRRARNLPGENLAPAGLAHDRAQRRPVVAAVAAVVQAPGGRGHRGGIEPGSRGAPVESPFSRLERVPAIPGRG